MQYDMEMKKKERRTTLNTCMARAWIWISTAARSRILFKKLKRIYGLQVGAGADHKESAPQEIDEFPVKLKPLWQLKVAILGIPASVVTSMDAYLGLMRLEHRGKAGNRTEQRRKKI